MKSYCTTPSIGVGLGELLKFYVKIFLYVMGKALTGELSCLGDRSCLT